MLHGAPGKGISVWLLESGLVRVSKMKCPFSGEGRDGVGIKQ